MLPQQCVCWPDCVGYVFWGIVDASSWRSACSALPVRVQVYFAIVCLLVGIRAIIHAVLMLIIQSVLMRVLQLRHPVFSPATDRYADLCLLFHRSCVHRLVLLRGQSLLADGGLMNVLMIWWCSDATPTMYLLA